MRTCPHCSGRSVDGMECALCWLERNRAYREARRVDVWTVALAFLVPSLLLLALIVALGYRVMQ